MMDLETLLQKNNFDKQEICFLLSLQGEQAKKLLDKSLEMKLKYLDNKVHLRGLIEYSNICEKNCLYCGLRTHNVKPVRYTMTDEEVVACAELAMQMNYGSVALQCGERSDRVFTDKITHLVEKIKKVSDGKLGITLSCGEQTKEVYTQWFNAGAHRYLLRIESSNENLYYKIHPKNDMHSFFRRLECIDTLQNIGYQTGTGVMIGLPFQTVEDLAEDILFFKKKDVAMVGMGPFIPHSDTPLWQYSEIIPNKKDRMLLTLKMIAILRIMMPEINMVSATANQTLDPLGREKAIMAGANVIMPNLTPNKYREEYLIYPDKACVGDKPEECYHCLDLRMHSIDHEILYSEWGDSKAFLKKNAIKQ